MVYVPAPGVLQVIQYFASGVANMANVWHVLRGSGTWDVAEIDAIIDVFENWESTDASANRSNEITCTGFRATDLTSLAGRSVFRSINVSGLPATPPVPINSTFAIKLQTGFRGRGTNGRIFWVGLTEAAVSAYTVTSVAANAIRDSVQNLIDDINAAGDYSLAVLHKVVAGAPINPYTASPVLGAAYTDLTSDSQVNRLPGHKRHKRTIAAIAP